MNDRRLQEIESKGYADSSTVEQLSKINTTIDSCKERLDLIETADQRPEVLDISNNAGSKEIADYIRKGMPSDLSKKTLSRDKDSNGGYFITPQIMKRIYKSVTDSSPMRQICSSQKISTETLECIIEGGDRAEAGWSGETTTVNSAVVAKYNFAKDTSTPQVKKISIMTYELYAQPQISQRLLDDAFVDVESWLIDNVAETFGTKENAAFINGNGSFQPKGILAYDDEIEKVTNNQLDSDAITTLYYSLRRCLEII